MTTFSSDLVRLLHREAGDRVHHTGTALDPATERMQFQAAAAAAVRDHSIGLVNSGVEPLTPADEQQLVEHVVARMFGAGRLQPLLQDETIEDISINGPGTVFVTRAGGVKEQVEPVADSDEELRELVGNLAAYAGLNARPFDEANPQLDLRLPDGSRLSAVLGVCAHPVVSIRRNRLESVSLEDLVRFKTVTEEVAEFLRAMVAARCNIMIAGATNAGKTTLLRALAGEIDPGERLVTVENALELGLGATGRHPDLVEFEVRLPNSEGVGGVPMGDLVRRSLRMSPDRVIVGEVLGPEIITMLNAMTQGNDGSMSTIHARSSAEVFNRITTYALQSEERMPKEAALGLIAGGLDFVLFVERHRGTGERRLSSIREITGQTDDGMIVTSEVVVLDNERAIFNPDVAGLARTDQFRDVDWEHPASRWGAW
ncbi:CpaF family protein [Nocardioides limicola]|uniref:CpaF family protein n=1 Tax=Nocardioides limicola TaxID=2803368 RepID=UPI00193AFB47|nr:ATPase, T2SS/T4P/T4SS family [Nocardioides sp. DJM-14]